jgi:hypothetical protein
MKFPHALFKRAGLNSTDVANLFGVSRVTGARWLSGVDRNGNAGVGVNKFLETKVAKVANAIMMAVDLHALPSDELAKLPPEKRARALNRIVSSLKPR